MRGWRRQGNFAEGRRPRLPMVHRRHPPTSYSLFPTPYSLLPTAYCLRGLKPTAINIEPLRGSSGKLLFYSITAFH